jgi:hypothetical protein
MARAKKSGRGGGAAARARGDRGCDSDFTPKKAGLVKRSPPKREAPSPPKKTTNPRKGRKPEQQPAAIDEGIGATPDDTALQGQPENDEDSTYASSPQKQTVAGTLQGTPARRNAGRNTRRKKVVFDDSLGKLGGTTGEVSDAPGVATRSKVVVLKVAPDKLRQVQRAYAPPEKKVALGLPPEVLRRFVSEHFEGYQSLEPALQPGELGGEEEAGMAPVKEKSPHDVLDGALPVTDSSCPGHGC